MQVLSIVLQNSEVLLLALFALLTFVVFYVLIVFLQSKKSNELEHQLFNSREELLKEKSKAQGMLARFFPHETAVELQKHGRAESKKYKTVTVLFSDIQGFSKITDEINAEELIDQLDKFYYRFDEVVKKYNIEKIKTIGDAYMCAGGIPIKNQTNPIEVVLAALEMIEEMKMLNKLHRSAEDIWELRMGIDTGSVIAGVVGQTKLSYDIWGGTVNVASRMESAGVAGKVNITENTYMLVNSFFECEYRGIIPIKNKGDVKMYFVKGICPHLSVNGLGVYPNDEFFLDLQFIRLADLEEYMLQKLEQGLPKNLYYHNLKHTIDVYTQVELIGRKERVSKADMLILRTAALFHDAGHLVDYEMHEELGVNLAHEILPDFKYSPQQIERVSELILATKMPPNPRNKLEQIICDADLDYLGRTDFIPVSNMLYKEMHERGKVGSIYEWNQVQINFIESHQYFTQTAINQRDVNKATQLQNIKLLMSEMEK